MPVDDQVQARLTAAEGFIDLDMHLQASEELDRIAQHSRHQPEVLAMRLRIYRALEKWRLMQAVAKALVRGAPQKIDFWLAYAFATKRAESIEKSIDILRNASEKFPNSAAIHFDLASYYSHCGDHERGRKHLKRGLKLEPGLRQMALDEPNFSALWDAF
jgi:uncharacterized protein HemY